MELFINIENVKITSGIYSIQNIHNNKRYIGKSKNIKKRIMSHHIYEYKNSNNECYNCKFYQALRKYGLSSFKFEILEECEIKDLDDREVYWINYYDTFKHGYNSTLGGKNLSSKIFSKESSFKRQNTLTKNKSLKSENHPLAKLKNEEVINIRKRYIEGETTLNIYQDYKNLYSYNSFKRIIFGYTYKDVGYIPLKENIRYTNKDKSLGKIDKEIIINIRNDYKSKNYTYKLLAEKYGLSISTIGKIVNYQLYKYIN